METKPQLQAIQVTWYRNLEMETPVQLEDLNILIGANGSGKTNLLEAIEFLPDVLKEGLPDTLKKRMGVDSILTWTENFLPKSTCPGN